MTWKKMPNVGDRETITIKQIGTESGRFGMQVHFRGENDDDIYLPVDVAYLWLERCGFGTAENMEFDDVIGSTLAFERTENPGGGRPHWKIMREGTSAMTPDPMAMAKDGATGGSPPAGAGVTDRARGATVSRPSPTAGGLNDHLPPARAAAPGPVISLGKEARRADIEDAYTWALAAVTRAQLAAAKQHKTAPKPTAASIQEGVTTLMLRAERLNAI